MYKIKIKLRCVVDLNHGKNQSQHMLPAVQLTELLKAQCVNINQVFENILLSVCREFQPQGRVPLRKYYCKLFLKIVTYQNRLALKYFKSQNACQNQRYIGKMLSRPTSKANYPYCRYMYVH